MKKIELIEDIITTKKDLEVANKNFELAEKELIDYYAYQIKANKLKLDYLIKIVKKEGISVDMITDLEININKKQAI